MIEWMITSSMLILLVLVLRALVKNRAGARLRYALWLLAAVRLLLPGTLFTSAVSVLNAAQANQAYQLAESLPSQINLYEDGRVRSVAGSADSFKMEPGDEKLQSGYGWTASPDQAEVEDMKMFGYRAVDTRTLERLVDLKSILMWVWQIGVWAGGTFLLTVNLRFWLRLTKKRRPAGSYRGRRVYIAEGLASPCLFGLFRSAVYLTPGLSETEREHVLAHEYTHFRHGDHVWAVWRGVCLMLHWYNPLVWLAAALSRRDCELACDEGAVKLLGEEHRAGYGRTLVGLVAGRTGPADLVCCATTMTGGKSAVKERIALLVKRPRTTAVMAVLVAAACLFCGACVFTGPKRIPATPEEMTTIGQRSQGVTASTNLEEVTAERVFEEQPKDMARLLLSAWFESIERYEMEPRDALRDSYIISLEIREERRDYGTGDVQAAFEVEYAVRVGGYAIRTVGAYSNWWAGNGVSPNELEGDVYRRFDGQDGWIVKYGEGYVVRDGGTGLWSIPELGTGGYTLNYLGLDGKSHNWIWTRPLPEDLPTEAGTSSDFWELLAALPGEDIALYRRPWDTELVYLRYGEHFQIFEQSLEGLDLLPMMGRMDPAEGQNLTVYVDYRRHEGTYFNGETTEPGVVSNRVYYEWNGAFWESWQIFSQPPQTADSDLPALEDLPTQIVRMDAEDPTFQASVWLLAELPEDGIAAYLDRNSGSCFLRYGNDLQWVDERLDGPWLPELRFERLDSDKEKKLAVFYAGAAGTGVSQTLLTVYEWEGGRWTAHTAGLEQDIIRDFNRGYTLALFPDMGYAEVAYPEKGNAIYVDMDARFPDRSQWTDTGIACELREEMVRYSMGDSYNFLLEIGGELRPAGFAPTTCYAFSLVCNVYYDNGTFWSTWSALDTDYKWEPRVDTNQLTPVFRRILRDFIAECRDAAGDEDISGNRFAVCDVNGDGRDELLTQLNSGIIAGLAEHVYSADGNELFSAFPDITYYSNGIALAGWSHNQGWAGDKLWPYDLFRWNGKSYEKAASVDGFNKTLRDGMGADRFPDEIDKDGDGYLYYIITESGGYAPDYGTPMDNADYEAWLDSYIGGAAALDVTYIPLTEENISAIG